MKLFNETLSNIFINFVPNKLITVDNRNPPWVTERIKKLLIDKSILYKLYIINGKKIGVYEKLLNMTNNMTTETSNNKKIYFDNLAEKLSEPKLNLRLIGASLSFLPTGKKLQLFLPYS